MYARRPSGSLKYSMLENPMDFDSLAHSTADTLRSKRKESTARAKAESALQGMKAPTQKISQSVGAELESVSKHLEVIHGLEDKIEKPLALLSQLDSGKHSPETEAVIVLFSRGLDSQARDQLVPAISAEIYRRIGPELDEVTQQIKAIVGHKAKLLKLLKGEQLRDCTGQDSIPALKDALERLSSSTAHMQRSDFEMHVGTFNRAKKGVLQSLEYLHSEAHRSVVQAQEASVSELKRNERTAIEREIDILKRSEVYTILRAAKMAIVKPQGAATLIETMDSFSVEDIEHISEAALKSQCVSAWRSHCKDVQHAHLIEKRMKLRQFYNAIALSPEMALEETERQALSVLLEEHRKPGMEVLLGDIYGSHGKHAMPSWRSVTPAHVKAISSAFTEDDAYRALARQVLVDNPGLILNPAIHATWHAQLKRYMDEFKSLVFYDDLFFDPARRGIGTAHFEKEFARVKKRIAKINRSRKVKYENLLAYVPAIAEQIDENVGCVSTAVTAYLLAAEHKDKPTRDMWRESWKNGSKEAVSLDVIERVLDKLCVYKEKGIYFVYHESPPADAPYKTPHFWELVSGISPARPPTITEEPLHESTTAAQYMIYHRKFQTINEKMRRFHERKHNYCRFFVAYSSLASCGNSGERSGIEKQLRNAYVAVLVSEEGKAKEKKIEQESKSKDVSRMLDAVTSYLNQYGDVCLLYYRHFRDREKQSVIKEYGAELFMVIERSEQSMKHFSDALYVRRSVPRVVQDENDSSKVVVKKEYFPQVDIDRVAGCLNALVDTASREASMLDSFLQDHSPREKRQS